MSVIPDPDLDAQDARREIDQEAIGACDACGVTAWMESDLPRFVQCLVCRSLSLANPAEDVWTEVETSHLTSALEYRLDPDVPYPRVWAHAHFSVPVEGQDGIRLDLCAEGTNWSDVCIEDVTWDEFARRSPHAWCDILIALWEEQKQAPPRR